MGFVGVYTAIYDYAPQGEGELDIKEGNLLYVLDTDSEDGWWKVKKKAEREDEDEPEGLVPNNYIEEAQHIAAAKALYDYTRQTDEEVSFSEDSELVVYDTSDPDWILVGVGSDFGFAPSNYIEIGEPGAAVPQSVTVEESAPPPALPHRPAEEEEEEVADDTSERKPSIPSEAAQNPAAAAIANIIHQQNAPESEPEPEPAPPLPARQSYSEPRHVDDDEEAPPPALPRRPPSQQVSSPVERTSSYDPPAPRHTHFSRIMDNERDGHVRESPPFNRVGQTVRSSSAYHLYNINEMVEAMGRRKKLPTTLGINIATGTIFISAEGDDHQQEWTAERLSHYSIEGKHVFMDLVRPSRSIDFHAGAKDTAQEIVAALGEIAGGYRAEGLREVLAAGTSGGQKTGQILYDFMAQGDDEVTVAVDDEVIILDDTKSAEWWMVRRLKNGKEGVVPSSYVEVTGTTSPEKNRLEESRMSKAAMRKSGTGSMTSPSPERQKRGDSKPKPDPTQTRYWTDRTKTFTVEAQFIGLHDGKIHLHKMNGVKIAVPISKMAIEDLEYVEKITGVNLDEDKPLSDVRRRGKAGATVKPPEYDWFDFFLKAGVGVHQCERYAQNFIRDSMDETVLPDITPETLRSLGLKEGDILRVMRYLDNTLGRTGSKTRTRNVSFGGEQVIGNGDGSPPGIFSGPGGALHNNTRKSRPTPAVQTSDVVDPKAFEQPDEGKKESSPAGAEKPVPRGFDDDAWEVKHPRQSTPAPATTSPASPPSSAAPPATMQPPPKPLSSALADLASLHPPLQPSPATSAPPVSPPPAPAASAPMIQPQPTAIQPQPTAIQPQPTAIQSPQQTGATPGFFSQLGPQPLQPQLTGYQQQNLPIRQQSQLTGQNPLVTSLPQRPLSAPQNVPQHGPFGTPPPLHSAGPLQSTGPAVAPPGQSLAELNQQRFQQPQPTGFMGPSSFQSGIAPQPTGFPGQPGFQPLTTQPTGFGGFTQPQPPPQQPMPTGINTSLPPPPLLSQPTGLNGMYGTMPVTNSPPPVPPIPPQPTASPLAPQKTGPPPPVRFGVKPGSKLTPQSTGMKANLAYATPANPFGF